MHVLGLSTLQFSRQEIAGPWKTILSEKSREDKAQLSGRFTGGSAVLHEAGGRFTGGSAVLHEAGQPGTEMFKAQINWTQFAWA